MAHTAARKVDLARMLLRDLPLTPQELRTRVDQATDAAYWRALSPGLSLHVEGQKRPAPAARPTERAAATVRQLQQSGYFEAGPVVKPPQLRQMRAAIDAVRKARWPPVFAFVYDAFWTIWSAPPLHAVLEGTLGPGYQLIAHPWCWYVSGGRDASGWGPHIDGPTRRNRVSVWVALSDATLDNGCMYVVPKDRVAHLPVRAMTAARSTYAWGRWRGLMHACRALPTPAGSAIGWDFETVHWGSICHRAGEPRVSIAAYFMPGDARPLREERQRFEPFALPSFTERLQAIAFSVRYFRANDVRNLRYLDLADRLRARAGRRGLRRAQNP